MPSSTRRSRSSEGITWKQALARRVRRHSLDRRADPGSLEQVVAGICGLHAQVLSFAALSLWARCHGVTGDTVPRLLWRERRLVKTWAMRGTLHLFPAAEYALWQAALSTHGQWLRPSWLRYFGVTADEMERLTEAISKALDGRSLTREELAVTVARETRSGHLAAHLRQSWGTLLRPAAFQGHLCFAPGTGTNVRFTNPRHWIGEWQPARPEDSLLEVTRRFLRAYGPATRLDFARWWGTGTRQAGRLLEQCGSEIRLAGEPAWIAAGDTDREEPCECVRLLPAFDPYVVAASPHVANLLPGPFRQRIFRPQGWISPVILVNGRLEGVWWHERKSSRVEVRLEPFRELPKRTLRAVEAEAGRLAEFFGGELSLTVAGAA